MRKLHFGQRREDGGDGFEINGGGRWWRWSSGLSRSGGGRRRWGLDKGPPPLSVPEEAVVVAVVGVLVIRFGSAGVRSTFIELRSCQKKVVTQVMEVRVKLMDHPSPAEHIELPVTQVTELKGLGWW
ncbi:hypothetical protein RHMOL_Rhmol02G0132400 [Rhododendron molle]|uniref:Uncharacterized protein n=1 Tax=Rhododendron molle TaxID=49168 RepID=A0ACC0PRB6_RHOML|nr:hypothetical protein RHMOL_Rhmol02G0132400 [Rhododendron molle]